MVRLYLPGNESRLPFKTVWHEDFEFSGGGTGDVYQPVCFCAYEERSGLTIKLWGDEMIPGQSPFPLDDETVVVGFTYSAEAHCREVLSWPQPRFVIDLFAEHRCETNGRLPPPRRNESYNSLPAAMIQRGLGAIAPEEKKAMQKLIGEGGPFPPELQGEILAYCLEDVLSTAALRRKMESRLAEHPTLFHALVRGRYMVAAGRIEKNGIPIDMGLHNRIERFKEPIVHELINRVNERMPVFSQHKLKFELLAAWVKERPHLDWPLTATGIPSTKDQDIKEREDLEPDILPDFRQVMKMRRQLRSGKTEPYAIGRDDRARTMLSCFASKTGRNQPRRFIFGAPKYERFKIHAGPERALFYADYKSQEVWIAAYLSRDEKLIEAVQSGDPYMAFARQVGLCPSDATEESHPRIREIAKVLTLGSNYGMGATLFARKAGISEEEAASLLEKRHQLYSRYTAWSERAVIDARNQLTLTTRLGWTLHTDVKTLRPKPNTALNFPMQATAGDMLRLACSLAVEDGLQVCATIHDALLIECSQYDIPDTAERIRRAMQQASKLVLGVELPVDGLKTPFLGRFEDGKGRKMFDQVLELLKRFEAEAEIRLAG